MTSQSYLLNDDQEICLAFGNICFWADRDFITLQWFLVKSEQQRCLALAMLEYCRPGINDVTIIFVMVE